MSQGQNLMSDDEKKKAVEALTKKNVKTQCPMCGNNNFILAEGYFNHTMQGNLNEGILLGGPSIPTVGIICTKCGFISQHALGVLGLLQNPERRK